MSCLEMDEKGLLDIQGKSQIERFGGRFLSRLAMRLLDIPLYLA